MRKVNVKKKGNEKKKKKIMIGQRVTLLLNKRTNFCRMFRFGERLSLAEATFFDLLKDEEENFLIHPGNGFI